MHVRFLGAVIAVEIFGLGWLGSATAQITPPPEAFFERVADRHREVARQFYQKYLDIDGLPVVAAAEVDDRALIQTATIVRSMLAGRPDVQKAMAGSGMYLIIIGRRQVYTDMPEYRDHPEPEFINERVRGTGGRPTSFGEENLLSWPIDRYDDESIAVHEFAHTIDGTLRRLDPDWTERRNTVYRHAMQKGLWRGTYAASNPGEYWAEIVQCYFDCNRVNNWNHGPIATREQLQQYDPEGYELVRSTLRIPPDRDWRYQFLKQLPCVEAPPPELGLDPYFTKYTWAREFLVLGRTAGDESLLYANHTIRQMFAYRHDMLKGLIALGVRLYILGAGERVVDLPDYRHWQDITGLDPALRRVDYSPATRLLVVDQEAIGKARRRGSGEDDPVVRAMALAVWRALATRPVDPAWEQRPRRLWQQYELGLERVDERFRQRSTELFEQATQRGLWRGTAGGHSPEMYWTKGVLIYFGACGQDHPYFESGRPVDNQAALKEYDPDLYEFIEKAFARQGRPTWQAVRE
ncbi:MAG: hypothetical protein KatS3mg110_1882 [Pirellulaceae bacterium]|nr:MAG: hypothetical protein KatS3mg110_1882 [Pirellulaceae bacterium]